MRSISFYRFRYECANQTDGLVFEYPIKEAIDYTPTFTYHGYRFVELSAVQIDATGVETPVPLAHGAAVDAFPFTAKLTAHRAHSDVRQLSSIDLRQPANPKLGSVATSTLVGQTFNATISSHIANLW